MACKEELFREPLRRNPMKEAQAFCPTTPLKKRNKCRKEVAGGTPSKKSRRSTDRESTYTDAECEILAAAMVKYKGILENAKSTAREKQSIYEYMVTRLLS